MKDLVGRLASVISTILKTDPPKDQGAIVQNLEDIDEQHFPGNVSVLHHQSTTPIINTIGTTPTIDNTDTNLELLPSSHRSLEHQLARHVVGAAQPT